MESKQEEVSNILGSDGMEEKKEETNMEENQERGVNSLEEPKETGSMESSIPGHHTTPT